jgi:hypothetical protein
MGAMAEAALPVFLRAVKLSPKRPAKIFSAKYRF